MAETVGKILLKQVLPADIAPFIEAGLDKKSIFSLMGEIAEKYPQHYKEILQSLHEIGGEAATFHGGST